MGNITGGVCIGDSGAGDSGVGDNNAGDGNVGDSRIGYDNAEIQQYREGDVEVATRETKRMRSFYSKNTQQLEQNISTFQ